MKKQDLEFLEGERYKYKSTPINVVFGAAEECAYAALGVYPHNSDFQIKYISQSYNGTTKHTEIENKLIPLLRNP